MDRTIIIETYKGSQYMQINTLSWKTIDTLRKLLLSHVIYQHRITQFTTINGYCLLVVRPFLYLHIVFTFFRCCVSPCVNIKYKSSFVVFISLRIVYDIRNSNNVVFMSLMQRSIIPQSCLCFLICEVCIVASQQLFVMSRIRFISIHITFFIMYQAIKVSLGFP